MQKLTFTIQTEEIQELQAYANASTYVITLKKLIADINDIPIAELLKTEKGKEVIQHLFNLQDRCVKVLENTSQL